MSEAKFTITSQIKRAARNRTKVNQNIVVSYIICVSGYTTKRPTIPDPVGAHCRACEYYNGQTCPCAGSVTLRATVGWPGERPPSYYPARAENGAMRCVECDAADVSE
jgi:hypothetical protein